MRVKVACFIAALTLSFSLLSVAPTQATARHWEKVACRFPIPASQTVECGDLTVPENRNDPTGRTVRLHVGIFKAKSAHPLEPVIYLEGGPGGHALQLTTQYRAKDVFAFVQQDHDLIILDQRGTGYSEPSLDCPELTTYYYSTLDQVVNGFTRTYEVAAALQTCRKRFVDEGIDLTAYSSAANAADVEDLRLALGYKQWDLYGISYGTRLALAVMRDYPRGVRSVILDSTLTGLHGFPTANYRRAFDVLFQGCARDLLCNRFYPNLEQTYRELLIDLNTKPVTVDVKHPITGKPYRIAITGNDVTSALFSSLYSTSVIPRLPSLLAEAHAGHYDALAQIIFNSRVVGSEFISLGMNLLVNCADGAILAASCQQLGAALPDTRPSAVRSRIPTLVLEGEYDPITPPSYSKQVIDTLSKSYYYEFPGIGHGVSVADPCPASMMLAFLKNPAQAPNSACIRHLSEPHFSIRAEF